MKTNEEGQLLNVVRQKFNELLVFSVDSPSLRSAYNSDTKTIWHTHSHSALVLFMRRVEAKRACKKTKQKKTCTNFVLCIFVRTHSDGAAYEFCTSQHAASEAFSTRCVCVGQSVVCCRWSEPRMRSLSYTNT